MDSVKKKAVLNWSGGKDSAFALQKVLQAGEYEIVSLLTVINKERETGSFHNIPVSILKKQADSIGVPLYTVALDPHAKMGDYETVMKKAVDYFKEQGVEHFIFGDICLHDVKSYREEKLFPHGIQVVEPLWGKTSQEVMQEFLTSGIKTAIIVTNADELDASFVGRTIDEQLVADLPANVDVCGENGEYHTFCYEADFYKIPLTFSFSEPKLKSVDINLSDGSVGTYHYWYVDVQE